MSFRSVCTAAAVLLATFGLSVPALAQCDITGPSLDGLALTPATVDTTGSAAQNVTCTMTISDDLAGTSEAACLFFSPIYLQSHTCVATSPVAGTPQNGTYECTVTLPRYAEAGTWSVSIDVADAVSNKTTYIYLDLLTAGLPAQITVTSDSDTSAPGLTAFSLSPSAVNVSASALPVTCSMALTDARSGVSAAGCIFLAPGQVQGWTCEEAVPSSGTPLNGTYECSVQIPQYAEAGTWEVTAYFGDTAGNAIQVSPPALQAAGFGKEVVVTSSPEDVTAPSQTSFGFSPVTVDSGLGPTTVTCTIGVSDDLSGVSGAGCTFLWIDPVTYEIQFQSCTSETPASGTRLSGTFECGVVLPRHSAGGDWFASTVLVDGVGNSSDFQPATPLDVECGAAIPEVALQWPDPGTVGWDAMSGASRYNVYRDVSTGLPSGGYGDCQNGRDGDPSDTLFAEADTPAAGEVFHFLVSYTSGSVEQGLGTDSGGAPRSVVPCP